MSALVDLHPATRTQSPRTADHLVSALVRLGVEVAFGVPGGTIGPVYDALLGQQRIRLVDSRHEGEALYAAAAYARVSGRLPVVLVTSGPGVLNAVTGLASARADGVPLLMLVGEVPRGQQGRGVLQDGSAHHHDVLSTLRAHARLVTEVRQPGQVEPMLWQAARAARSDSGGPGVLVLPVDVQRLPVGGQLGAPSPLPPVPTGRVDLEPVLHALGTSTRTLILAGSGCRGDGGPRALRRLQEHLGATVATTPKAKGVFPESHPASVGIYGVGGHASATAWLEQERPEVVLALGTSLGDFATNGWASALRPSRSWVQVDRSPGRLGRSYDIDHAVLMEVSAFAREVLRALPRASTEARHAAEVAGVVTREDPAQLREDPHGIHPARAVWELQRVLPPDTLFTVDSGEHTLFAAHYLRIDHPDAFVAALGLGAMGSGIAGALGAQLAAPDRTVACICGDGGLLMTLGAVSTAAAEGLPIRWFVFNDGAYGMVRHGQQAIFGRTHAFSTGSPDLVQVAGALGATGLRVDRVEAFAGLGDALAAIDGPVVVDVRIDPRHSMPKGARFEGLGG